MVLSRKKTSAVPSNLVLPEPGTVRFTFKKAGSKPHFGVLRDDGVLIANRRVHDGVVKFMAERRVDLDEVKEIISIDSLPKFRQPYCPANTDCAAQTPQPSSGGSASSAPTLGQTPAETGTTTEPEPASTASDPLPLAAGVAPLAPTSKPVPPRNALNALVGQPVPVTAVGDQAANHATPEDEDEFINFGFGDLLCDNVPLGSFQPRHPQPPRVADLKGGFLTGIHLRPHDQRMLPHAALAKSTVLAHRRMLTHLSKLPKELQHLPLGTALANYFNQQRATKRLRWSTTMTKMATAHGALRLLPIYTGQPSVMMKECVVWMQSMKAVGKQAKQEVPNQATPASWILVEKAIESESESFVRMALLLTWLTCGRGGDVLQLEPNCVEVQEEGLMVHFRRGKTVKTRGAYSIFTPLPPLRYRTEFMEHLRVAVSTKRKWLFEQVQGNHVKIALRRAHPKLEQRSLRRGSIQTLAASGLSDEELLKYSGHTNVQMLRRYLNFGKLSGEGKRLQQQAGHLLLSSPPTLKQ